MKRFFGELCFYIAGAVATHQSGLSGFLFALALIVFGGRLIDLHYLPAVEPSKKEEG